MNKRMVYEVETRVIFHSNEEAYETLPFLKQCLKKITEFQTNIYGIELFNQGKLLRVADVNTTNNIKRTYIGYKEADIGKIYNVRNEIDEEITNGLTNSFILNYINKVNPDINPTNINDIYEELGYKQFMKLVGTNYTGHYNGIAFKLLNCPNLQYPVMLEIEKSALTLLEAYQKELELKEFIINNKLEDRVIKEEPPTLFRYKL